MTRPSRAWSLKDPTACADAQLPAGSPLGGTGFSGGDTRTRSPPLFLFPHGIGQALGLIPWAPGPCTPPLLQGYSSGDSVTARRSRWTP